MSDEDAVHPHKFIEIKLSEKSFSKIFFRARNNAALIGEHGEQCDLAVSIQK